MEAGLGAAAGAAAEEESWHSEAASLTRLQLVEATFQRLFPDAFLYALPVWKHKVGRPNLAIAWWYTIFIVRWTHATMQGHALASDVGAPCVHAATWLCVADNSRFRACSSSGETVTRQ